MEAATLPHATAPLTRKPADGQPNIAARHPSPLWPGDQPLSERKPGPQVPPVH